MIVAFESWAEDDDIVIGYDIYMKTIHMMISCRLTLLKELSTI